MDHIACVAMGHAYSLDIPKVPYTVDHLDSVGKPVHGNRSTVQAAAVAVAAGLVGLASHMAAD